MTDELAVETTENDTPPDEAVFLGQDSENAPAEQVEATEEQAQDRDWESEAREMGWVPEDDFKGDKRNWRPAQEFVKRGEEFIPFLKADKKKLEAQLAKERAEADKRIERLEKAQQRSIEALKKQHEKEVQQISVQMRKAVADGDVDAYERLEKQRDELAQQKIDAPDQSNPEAVQKDWMAKNDWYQSDFELNREATEYSQFLAQQNPEISLGDNLQKVEAYIKEKHPEKFGGQPKRQPAANGHAAVDGGGILNASPPRKATLFDKLPKEAKAQFQSDVTAGLFQKSQAEEWAKIYNS